jgi:hypothetical protein
VSNTVQYRYEVEVADGSPSVWYTNALRFDTVEEAEAAALSHADRWILVVKARVVTDDTPMKEAVDETDERIVFGAVIV